MNDEKYFLIVGGAQIPLRKIDDVKLVTPLSGKDQAKIASILARFSGLTIDQTFPSNLLVVRGDKKELEQLRSEPDIENTRAAFQDSEGNLLVLTNEILISFRDGVSDDDREKLLGQLDGRVVERKPGFWKFRVNDPSEDAPLLLANELSKESIVRYAEPNAVQGARFQQLPQTEPLFPNQWHLQNTGQNSGTVGADVSAHGRTRTGIG